MSTRGLDQAWPARPLRTAGALLKLGYRCNNACRFCHSAPHRGVELDTAAVLRRLEQVVAAGCDRVVLSGGEPTIRPDLVGLVKAASDLGLAVGLVTNGRMLAYPSLRRELLGAGLSQVYLSLHSHRAAVHDHLVRAEAFGETVRAARWLSGCDGLTLMINCVVTRSNLDDLPGLTRLVAGMGRRPRDLKLSFVEPEGAVLGDFEALVPALPLAAARVVETVGALSGAARDQGLRLTVDGFPQCLVPRELMADLWTEGFVYLMEAFETALHRVDDLNRDRGEPCRRCVLDGCPGVYKTYVAQRGDAELVPSTEARGSSTDYEALGAVAAPFDVRRCPARAGALPHPDGRRELLFRRGGAVTLYRAGAGDWSEWELERIKNRWQQVYWEDPSRPRSALFQERLVKLRPTATCDRCPHRGACGGLWVAQRRDVFRADEARVRAFVGGLRGHILDVGCGAASYLRALDGAVRRGEAVLECLDPDARAWEHSPAADIAAAFHVGDIEFFAPGGRTYDQVISIRSYSHFRDVDRAVQRIAGLLSPGGRFTVIGDCPVALLRSSEAIGRSHADASLALDHYRNQGPGQAWALIQRHPFRLRRLVEPDPRGSNLWWLELERVHER